MVIEVVSKIPVSRPIYRRSQAEMDEIEEQNQLLLEAGIVEESNSPYNNPIMAVRKKNGKIRLVNDFRGINAIMVSMTFPILMIGMILDLLSGNEYFSVLDMTSGFWQCPLDVNSRKYTAYSTPKGHYQYCVCPQGIKTGPSYFNLCVSRAMRQCKGFALNYFDDIVIFSKTIQEHLKHIRLVMEALKEYGFKISAEKSTWIAKEVPLLGFIISGKEIKVNPGKINTIRDRPEPKNSKQVETVLGLFQFYSRFIPDFANYSKILYNLVKKDVPWNWTEECSKAYKHFVKSITTEPAMRQPRLGHEFIVYSDGSKYAIGGILCQMIDGKEYIIEYASRLLKGSELNYGISDIECLAVVFLVKKWHHYLYGVHFIVYTDHKALLNLMNIRDYHGRLGRQAMFLQEYHFTIKYLPGKENSGADAASRPVLAITTGNKNQDYDQKSAHEKEGYKIIDPYEDLALLHYLKFNKHNDGLSKSQVKRVMTLKDRFRFKKDNETLEIIKNDNWLIYPKQDDRKQIILKAHLLGHFENTATVDRLRNRYYWRKMYQDVEYYIKRCLTCQRNKTMPALEHEAKVTPINHIFERICMDLVGGLPLDEEGFCKILVIVEFMTKMVTIFPIKSKTAEEIADNLWIWISRYGPPKTILSDQGTEFVNKTVSALLQKTGIERRVTSSYNPRTDGQCERMNQTVITILKKHAEAEPQNWRKWTSYVEYVYNTRKSSTTGFSPYELLYGVQPYDFMDYNMGDDDNEEQSLFERSKQLKKLIEEDREECIEAIKKSQIGQKKIQNKRTNPTDNQLKVGTKVMIKVEGLNSKLGQKYHGRYTIVGRNEGGNYKLQTAHGTEVKQSYPITKLKPIEEDDKKPQESVEIEKILEKRKNLETDEIEYLVKWKNFDHSENEWVPTNNFDELKMINDYNKSITKSDEKEEEPTSPIEKEVKRKRGRPRKTNVAALLTLIQLSLMIIGISAKPEVKTKYDSKSNSELLLGGIMNISSPKEVYTIKKTAIKIDEEFILCSKTNYEYLDINNNCKKRNYTNNNKFKEIDTYVRDNEVGDYTDTTKTGGQLPKIITPSVSGITLYETRMYVVAKQHNEVSGIAHECSFYKVEVLLETTLTNNKLPPRMIKTLIEPTEAFCKNLRDSKVCISDIISCDADTCESTPPNFDEDYSWWSTQRRTYHHCTIDTRRITVEKPNSEVFIQGCIANKGLCKMKESIIIWEKSKVIHKCPYELVQPPRAYRRIGETVVSNSSDTSNLLFKVEEKVNVCDQPIEMFRTSTGLYLTKWYNQSEQLKQIKSSQNKENAALQIITAENDFKEQQRISDTNTEFEQDCTEFFNNLRIAVNAVNDRFLRLTDLTGNELILYVSKNRIHVPHCENGWKITNIENIKSNNKRTECFTDIPIQYEKIIDTSTGKLYKHGSGYLTQEKIIRTRSNKIPCYRKKEVAIEIDNKTKLIIGANILNAGTQLMEYVYSVQKNNYIYRT